MQKLKQKEILLSIFSMAFYKQEFQNFAYLTNKFFRNLLTIFYQYSNKMMQPFKKICVEQQITYYNINQIDLIELVKINESTQQIVIYRGIQNLLTFYYFMETHVNQLQQLYFIKIENNFKTSRIEGSKMIQTGYGENNFLLLYVSCRGIENAFIFLKLNQNSNKFELIKKIQKNNEKISILYSMRNLENQYFLILNANSKFNFYESQIPNKEQTKLVVLASRSCLLKNRNSLSQIVELKDYNQTNPLKKGCLTSIIAYTFFQHDYICIMRIICDQLDSKNNLKTEELQQVKTPFLYHHALKSDLYNDGIIILVGQVSMPKEDITTYESGLELKNGILKIDLRQQQTQQDFKANFKCIGEIKIIDLHYYKFFNFKNSKQVNEKHQIMYSVNCDQNERFQILTYHTQKFEDGNCFQTSYQTHCPIHQYNYLKQRNYYGYLKCLQVSKNNLLVFDDDNSINQLIQLRLNFQ